MSDFDDYKVTVREILFSIFLLGIFVGIGVLISRPIISKLSDDALKVVSSVNVSDSFAFDYIRRTNAGEFLAEGELKTVNPVSIEDIDGLYSKIVKLKEEYTRHVRVYTTSDGETSTTHTQVYYSWDTVDTEVFKSDTVEFLGVMFPIDTIGFKFHTKTDTIIHAKGNFLTKRTRYVYYTCKELSFPGVLRGCATDKRYCKLSFSEGKTNQEVIEDAKKHINNTPIAFWSVYMFFVLAVIAIFCAFDNNWLEG